MQTAHLYAGPQDGAEAAVEAHVNYLFRGDTTYCRSAEWSAWFGRHTFVVSTHRGRPPARESVHTA